MPFGLQGVSPVLARVVNTAITRGLIPGSPEPGPAGPAPGPPASGVPGAGGPPHRPGAVCTDGLFRCGPSLGPDCRDVLEVLAIVRQPAGETAGPRHTTAGEAPLDGRAAPLRGGRVCGSHRRSVDGCADIAALRHEHDHNERPSLGHEAAPPLRRRLRGHRRPAGPAARPARPLALGPCRDGELRHAEAVTNDRPRCSRVRLEPALRGHGACEAAVSLPNPDDDGRHRPVACESRKSTAVEQACPLRVQELLAVLYALRALRH